MAVVKTYTQNLDTLGRRDKVQTLTQATTATWITNYGVTVITNSSADNRWVLNYPKVGLRKNILFDSNSTGDLVLIQPTTTVIFYGSTSNQVTASTGAGVKYLDLIGLSTTVWGVLGRSTGLTFAASTLSGL